MAALRRVPQPGPGAAGRAGHRRAQVAQDRRPVLMDAIRDLHPGYFAFVMATGIISTGTYLLGPSWLSRTLLVLTVAGLGVLSVALVIRLARFRSSVAADIRAPERVFGFFTVLAGAKILVLPGMLPAVRVTAGFVEGFSYALWAFGTWWIPLLVILGCWRHVRQRWPLTYEPPLWSVVKPKAVLHRPHLPRRPSPRLSAG